MFGILAVTAARAHAPATEAAGLSAGLLHPLSGWDHLLALLAVGLWVSRQGATEARRLSMVFTGVMLAGVLLGRTGLALPIVEAGIASSLLVLGLLLAFMARLPAAVSVFMVGLFAVFHGYAHGLEMPRDVSPLFFNMGLMLAAAALLGLAAGLGRRLPGTAAVMLLRAGGVATVTTGALMLV